MRSAAAAHKQSLDILKEMSTSQQLKKAPESLRWIFQLYARLTLLAEMQRFGLTQSCKFIQYCEMHPVEGKRRGFKRKQHPTPEKDDNDSS